MIFPPQWLLQSDALEGKGGPGCHRGGNSPNNGLICLLVFVQYAIALLKNIFWTTVTGSNKNNA